MSTVRRLTVLLLSAVLLTAFGGCGAAGSTDEAVPLPPATDLPSWTETPESTGSAWGTAISTAPDGASAGIGGYDDVILIGPAATPDAVLDALGESDAFVLAFDAQGQFAWARSIAGIDGLFATDVALAPDHQVTVVGYFTGTAVFDPAGPHETTLVADEEDAFVARYSPSGDLLWVRQLSGPGFDEALTVGLTSGGAVVVGGLLTDELILGPGEANETVLAPAGFLEGWLARYEADGSLGWAVATESSPTSYATVWDLDLDGTGHIVAAGEVYGTSAWGAGGPSPAPMDSADGTSDAYAARFTPTADVLWARLVGSPSQDYTYAVAAAADGSVRLAGAFRLTATADGGAVPDGTLESRGELDAFVAAWNAAGDLAWVLPVGGTGMDTAYGVDMRPDGCTVLMGVFSDSATIGADPFPTGTLESVGTGDDEVFLLCLDLLGNPLWSERLGGENGDFGVGLAVFADNDVVMTGTYVGPATYGDPLDPEATFGDTAGESAAFMIRLQPDGSYTP